MAPTTLPEPTDALPAAVGRGAAGRGAGFPAAAAGQERPESWWRSPVVIAVAAAVAEAATAQGRRLAPVGVVVCDARRVRGPLAAR